MFTLWEHMFYARVVSFPEDTWCAWNKQEVTNKMSSLQKIKKASVSSPIKLRKPGLVRVIMSVSTYVSFEFNEYQHREIRLPRICPKLPKSKSLLAWFLASCISAHAQFAFTLQILDCGMRPVNVAYILQLAKTNRICPDIAHERKIQI